MLRNNIILVKLVETSAFEAAALNREENQANEF